MSKWAFSMRSRPTVKEDSLNPDIKFPGNEKGGLIISADFEMAWAWRYTKTGFDYFKKAQIERQNFPEIIRLLDEYNVPVTFATVGHLFLEECNKGDHDWMRRIPHFDDHWGFLNGDWYDHDPYSSVKEAPEWYAPDFIEMILQAKTKHEIGSHTFSHIDFSYKNCPPEVAEDELQACDDAAKPFGVKPLSMVFPGGTFGNIEALKKFGYTIYRKRQEFELSYPYRDRHGLLVCPSSGCLEFNLDYGWSDHYFINRLKKIVSKAIKTNTIAHLWFHPSLDPHILKNILPPFFQFADEERKNGNLWIGTMADISQHINTNQIL